MSFSPELCCLYLDWFYFVCIYLLGKGGYVFGSIGLSICLFICLWTKNYEWIGMKFYGGALGSTVKKWLNFGGDLGMLRWVNE